MRFLVCMILVPNLDEASSIEDGWIQSVTTNEMSRSHKIITYYKIFLSVRADFWWNLFHEENESPNSFWIFNRSFKWNWLPICRSNTDRRVSIGRNGKVYQRGIINIFGFNDYLQTPFFSFFQRVIKIGRGKFYSCVAWRIHKGLIGSSIVWKIANNGVWKHGKGVAWRKYNDTTSHRKGGFRDKFKTTAFNQRLNARCFLSCAKTKLRLNIKRRLYFKNFIVTWFTSCLLNKN